MQAGNPGIPPYALVKMYRDEVAEAIAHVGSAAGGASAARGTAAGGASAAGGGSASAAT